VVTSIHLGFSLASFLYDYQDVDGGIKTLVREEDRIGFGDVISHAHVESTRSQIVVAAVVCMSNDSHSQRVGKVIPVDFVLGSAL
jgi:hypothetical protein